jgi:hypothetical protein
MLLAPTCPLGYNRCADANSRGPLTVDVRATHAALLGTRVWDSRAKDESGEPLPAPPSQVFVVNAVVASAGRCRGVHRKSSVIIRLSYACQVESYLLP